MDPRLIPLNGVLALLAQGEDAGWPNDLARQGFRLHLLEGDVQSTPQTVRADVIAYRRDPDLVLLFECKSGRNVTPRQARGYANARAEGLIRRGTLPSALRQSEAVAVQSVFVGRRQYGEVLAESLEREQIVAPLLLVGSDGATLTGSQRDGLGDFDNRSDQWGHPPGRVLVDHESPVEELMELLVQQVHVAFSRRIEVVDIGQVAAQIHPCWEQVSRVAQQSLIDRLKKAAQALARGEMRADVVFESSQTISPRLVLLSRPADADPRGAAQAWQGHARRAADTLGRMREPEIEGQLSISFEDLAAEAPSDDEPDDGLEN
jgi:hypothetical protein